MVADKFSVVKGLMVATNLLVVVQQAWNANDLHAIFGPLFWALIRVPTSQAMTLRSLLFSNTISELRYKTKSINNTKAQHCFETMAKHLFFSSGHQKPSVFFQQHIIDKLEFSNLEPRQAESWMRLSRGHTHTHTPHTHRLYVQTGVITISAQKAEPCA